MIKTYCDACGKEILSHSDSNIFKYLVHLDNIGKGKGNISGYVDKDMEPVSGRDIGVELCNKCYNRVVWPSVQELYVIKSEVKAND